MNKDKQALYNWLIENNCGDKENFADAMADLSMWNENAENISEFLELSNKEFWEVLLAYSWGQVSGT